MVALRRFAWTERSEGTLLAPSIDARANAWRTEQRPNGTTKDGS